MEIVDTYVGGVGILLKIFCADVPDESHLCSRHLGTALQGGHPHGDPATQAAAHGWIHLRAQDTGSSPH